MITDIIIVTDRLWEFVGLSTSREGEAKQQPIKGFEIVDSKKNLKCDSCRRQNYLYIYLFILKRNAMKKTFCFPYCRDGINFPFVVYRNLNGSHMTSFIQSQSVILVRGNRTLFCTNETLQYDLYIPVTFSGRNKSLWYCSLLRHVWSRRTMWRIDGHVCVSTVLLRTVNNMW